MATVTCTSSQSSIDSSGLLSPPSSPPEVPPCPYVKGAKFVVHRHEPKSTLEMGYHKPESSTSIPEVTGAISQFEWCVAHPPESGKTHLDEERCIEVTKVLRGGEACGAQTVLTADGFVAKFYDPMYYNFHAGFYRSDKTNVTAYADKHYITEAGAYAELRNTLVYGDITPEYHGSWTVDIPVLVGGAQKT